MSFNPSSFETNTLDIINIESKRTLQYRQDHTMSQYLIYTYYLKMKFENVLKVLGHDTFRVHNIKVKN
jgi:hypothetical protein